MTVALAEFDIIARYFTRTGLNFSKPGVLLGPGDDCALLAPAADLELAVSLDMLHEGVHFPPMADPFLLAQRCLLVNLSDLAAMGAAPLGFTLGLSMPAADTRWLERFSAGLAEVAMANACPLIGGDTTRGPLTICIQVHGCLPAGSALRRSAARPGDIICVTGCLGDAGAALAMIEGRISDSQLSPESRGVLLTAFYQPASRIAAGQALRGLANAAIDLSDGLASDLPHILKASAVGARVCLDELPLSSAFCEAVAEPQRQQLAASAGDDYELCFTVDEARIDRVEQALRELEVTVTRIGKIEAGDALQWHNAAGQTLQLELTGYAHFR